jgi:hypothetical protein
VLPQSFSPRLFFTPVPRASHGRRTICRRVATVCCRDRTVWCGRRTRSCCAGTGLWRRGTACRRHATACWSVATACCRLHTASRDFPTARWQLPTVRSCERNAPLRAITRRWHLLTRRLRHCIGGWGLSDRACCGPNTPLHRSNTLCGDLDESFRRSPGRAQYSWVRSNPRQQQLVCMHLSWYKLALVSHG